MSHVQDGGVVVRTGGRDLVLVDGVVGVARLVHHVPVHWGRAGEGPLILPVRRVTLLLAPGHHQSEVPHLDLS